MNVKIHHIQESSSKILQFSSNCDKKNHFRRMLSKDLDYIDFRTGWILIIPFGTREPHRDIQRLQTRLQRSLTKSTIISDVKLLKTSSQQQYRMHANSPDVWKSCKLAYLPAVHRTFPSNRNGTKAYLPCNTLPTKALHCASSCSSNSSSRNSTHTFCMHHTFREESIAKHNYGITRQMQDKATRN